MKEKGIWTWGHVIYDYRGFLRNMNRLGLNKITIWNDFAPVNAREILDEAHRYGIKVVWGFSWGWKTENPNVTKDIGPEGIKAVRKEVLENFEKQYSIIADDGIYFQSYTEFGENTIGGVNIAESVVELVNSTSSELFAKYPDLNIEFGLHATSVRNDLGKIARTDSRIKIIWEDMGAFPFAYEADDVRDFDKTLELARAVIDLRGENEKCGFITKAMTKLDWSRFKFATEPLTIGESSREFIENRQREKNPLWEKQTEGWLENYSYAKQMFELFASSENVVSVQSLIEDGMFENEIKEPAVIFSELCERKFR